jgi:serine/threonine protein kinase
MLPPLESMSGRTATVYEPGHIIAGKYELEELLGQGGMGAVWRARNVALDSLVALKVLRSTADRAALSERLVQEARAAAKLTHPAIVKVFDVGHTDSGDPFIVMELLHGSSLGTILATESRISSIQAARILLPIADALSLAHSKGIIHRDLKPDNVFVVHDGSLVQPKLVDFGIVKMQEDDGQSHLTQAGAVLGSPDYMSPEQARGQDDIGLGTDVWSFSVVLYEAITGRPPFEGNNYNALLRQIVEDTPASPEHLAATDAALSDIVMRGLSKRPEQRYHSMGELGRALASWLISQGVHEDICGTTLEPRWMRSTDPHARPAGRASLVSITEGWPSETGSGVRANAAVVNTLPAPPQLETQSKRPRPAARRVTVGASIAAAFVLGWWTVAALIRPDQTVPNEAIPALSGPAAQAAPDAGPHDVAGDRHPPEAGTSAGALSAELPAPPPAESAQSSSGNKAAAQSGARKVSSAGRPAGASRPAPQSPATRKPSGKPTGDLISPY